MFEPVYVCRHSWRDYPGAMITVVPAEVGIVKIAGCHGFSEAIKDSEGEYGFTSEFEVDITQRECQGRYSSVPAPGEAWLVTEGRKCVNWDRADQNMFLLNEDGSYHKSD